MKPVDVKMIAISALVKKLIINILMMKLKKLMTKFKVGDHVRRSEYKNIFATGYTPNWLKVFVIKKS